MVKDWLSFKGERNDQAITVRVKDVTALERDGDSFWVHHSDGQFRTCEADYQIALTLIVNGTL